MAAPSAFSTQVRELDVVAPVRPSRAAAASASASALQAGEPTR